MFVIPLKPKYQKIKNEMIKKYGAKKGEKIFYAWVNKQNVNPDLKSFSFITTQFKSLDDDTVEGFIASGLPDSYKDILTEDCLKDMEQQFKSLNITLDDNHESFKETDSFERMKALNPIAKVVDAQLKGFRIAVKTTLNKAHQRYEEIKSSIKNGFLHSFSFAFIPIDVSYKSIDGVKHRILNKVKLLNGCFTGVPVNDDASFTNVMLKSLAEFDFNEAEVNELIGGINMTDETVEKPESKPEEKSEETNKEIKDETKEPEKSSSETSEKTEVKALTEKINAINESFVEIKSLLEKKENKDLIEMKSKLEKLEAEYKALNEVMSAPQFKARVEYMKDAQTELEAKSKFTKGPVDFIK